MVFIFVIFCRCWDVRLFIGRVVICRCNRQAHAGLLIYWARGLAGLLRVVDLGGGGGHHADHVPGDLPYARTRLGQELTQSATFQRALTLDSAKVNWMLPTLLLQAPAHCSSLQGSTHIILNHIL